ncbi:hypothetical protein [Castellaniella sp.]|uniref:hypothetical protein n=1 Tax=Castellaniella sp. TaxID=1955812 RepID=UPI003A925792
MADLILLIFENGESVRCTDFNDAKSKAISATEGRIIAEVTMEGKGGPITTLEFNRNTREWIPV